MEYFIGLVVCEYCGCVYVFTVRGTCAGTWGILSSREVVY